MSEAQYSVRFPSADYVFVVLVRSVLLIECTSFVRECERHPAPVAGRLMIPSEWEIDH